MKRWRRIAVAIVGVVLFGAGARAAPQAAPELRMLTWADYIAPELVERFEQQTGVHITLDTIVSYKELNERFRAAPDGYDLINPADYEVADFAGDGLLERIDAFRLPGYANILDGWRSPPYDRKNEWSVPFHWGFTSFAVDTAVYRGEIDSYRLLFDPPPELKGREGFLIGAEETLRMALIWLGLPPCTSDRAQLQKAIDLVRPRLHKDRIYTISTVIEKLTGDGIAVGVAWNGDALRARETKPSLRFAYPKEGMLIWSDALAVPRKAKNRESALRFIAFMLEPENAAIQTNFTRYATAIRGADAWMDPALLDAPEMVIPSNVKVRFFRSCDSEKLGLYTEMWDPVLQELAR